MRKRTVWSHFNRHQYIVKALQTDAHVVTSYSTLYSNHHFDIYKSLDFYQN